jgi:hypothetical protein
MKTGWTIGRKLMASFLLVSAITAMLGGVGYYAVANGAKALDEVGVVRLPSVASLLTIDQSAENIRGTLRTLGITGLPADIRQRQNDNLAKARETYEAAWKVYEALPHTPEEAQMWAEFVPAWNAWQAENGKYLELCGQFDKNGIPDPVDLSRRLESFTKDHHKLGERVQRMLHAKELFEGGDDPAACNCGKWLPTFKTENADLARELQAIVEPHQQFHQAVKHIKQLLADGKAEEGYDAYAAEMAPAAERVFTRFAALLKVANESADLQKQAQALLLGPVTDKQRAVSALLDKLGQINRDVAGATVADSQRRAAMFKSVSLAAALLGVVAALGLGALITRGINRKLTRLATQLGEGADQVNDAAEQVSAASQQLAAGNSEQASSLEESSSALEQMAAMTRTTAENSNKANGLASQARQSADGSDQTMKQLNTAMAAINESASKIGKIIKVIEEIAFQTNLLALNAAVEAARAGEHGKGFAVVAEEVRNLAQRCAGAARDTTDLIEGSVVRAKEGTAVAEAAGQALQGIAGDITQVSDLLNGITTAANEQAQGVEQINVAVSQMDKVTQQNAAGAEESASAAEELSAQAQTVKGMVGELVAMVGGRPARSDCIRNDPNGAQNPRRSFGPRAAQSATVRPAAKIPPPADVETHHLTDF